MAGKGDKLRKGANLQAFWDNYDLIFSKNNQQCKSNEEQKQEQQQQQQPVHKQQGE